MIIYVLFVCSFAVATAEFVLVGLLPQVATDLDVSVAAAGQLVTAYMIVVTVGGPVATVLTRRLPRRELLAGTMALATVSAVASAMATSYPMLLSARLGSALAQALFMAVASQVAMASVPPERQTVAVARLFGGFALATVLGLPLGSLIGEAYGWPVTFVAVAGLAALGLLGVLVFCPRVPTPPPAGVRDSIGALLRPGIYAGLGVTLLALTGFVAAFTYVAPMLRTVTGLSPGWVSVGLVGYGLGTIAGNLLAGRVRPEAITRRLPLAVAVLTAILLAQPLLLPVAPLALAGLALLGAAAFLVVPLVQTWLMGQVDPATTGLVAAVNISVAGAAGALGAALGGTVLAVGLGPAWIGPVAAVSVLAATIVATRLHRVTSSRGPSREALVQR
ncbi:MFS transporter [Micromonospora sediminimaris]|uniref:MFS transporter n=1 Tax=Micromonospora sediminimaris TaxID=547162 RepID=A0A9W5UL83_9ACTN|nr:MFS transporter [Micromonospora sediminimaris]GIJ30989.1 MFS transporter [Micromonospora sediminimaris]SFC19244.1 MFS transporter, DHA1 family, inner membrane transport protein [Micromonospora sediminimaris]